LAHGCSRIRRVNRRFRSLLSGRKQQKSAAVDMIDAEKIMESSSFCELAQNFRRSGTGTEQGNNSRLSGKEQAR